MVVAASPSSSPAPHAAPGRPHPTYTKASSLSSVPNLYAVLNLHLDLELKVN
jgi:hypothetical protein